MQDVIQLTLTRAEAHVVLRSLAHLDSSVADQIRQGWIAERILRLVAPELGMDPIGALYERDADVQARALRAREDTR